MSTKAEHILTKHGVFAGHTGLRDLANSDDFWRDKMYGTRLYFGNNYLHRGVLKAAVEALDSQGAVMDSAKSLYSALDNLCAVVGLTPISGNKETLQDAFDQAIEALEKHKSIDAPRRLCNE